MQILQSVPGFPRGVNSPCEHRRALSTINYTIKVGSVKGRLSDDDDARRNTKAPLVLIRRHFTAFFTLHPAPRATGEGGARARDSTVYGGSSTSAKTQVLVLRSTIIAHTTRRSARSHLSGSHLVHLHVDAHTNRSFIHATPPSRFLKKFTPRTVDVHTRFITLWLGVRNADSSLKSCDLFVQTLEEERDRPYIPVCHHGHGDVMACQSATMWRRTLQLVQRWVSNRWA